MRAGGVRKGRRAMKRLTIPLLALAFAAGGCGLNEAERLAEAETQVRDMVSPFRADVRNLRLGIATDPDADLAQRSVCGEVKFFDPMQERNEFRNFVSISVNDVIMDPRTNPALACKPNQTRDCVPARIMTNMRAAQATFDRIWQRHCASATSSRSTV